MQTGATDFKSDRNLFREARWSAGYIKKRGKFNTLKILVNFKNYVGKTAGI
jgi:hypothetical protein